MSQKKTRSSELLPSKEEVEGLKFKKKSNKTEMARTDRSKPDSKTKVVHVTEKTQQFGGTVSPRAKKIIPVPKFEAKPVQNVTPSKLNKGFEGRISEIKCAKSSPSVQEMELPFEDELLSDLTEHQDSSIVSHIEVSKLGKNKFDKWDILYQDDE